MDEWTDKRMDDFAQEIRRRLAVMEKAQALMADTGERIVALDGRMQMIAEDAVECREGIREVRNGQAATANALKEWQLAQAEAKLEERAALAKERKSDRKWFVGTTVAVAVLIVATLSYLSQAGVLG